MKTVTVIIFTLFASIAALAQQPKGASAYIGGVHAVYDPLAKLTNIQVAVFPDIPKVRACFDKYNQYPEQARHGGQQGGYNIEKRGGYSTAGGLIKCLRKPFAWTLTSQGVFEFPAIPYGKWFLVAFPDPNNPLSLWMSFTELVDSPQLPAVVFQFSATRKSCAECTMMPKEQVRERELHSY